MSGEMLASSLHKMNNSVSTYNKTVLCPRPEFGPRRLKKFGIPFYNGKQMYSIFVYVVLYYLILIPSNHKER